MNIRIERGCYHGYAKSCYKKSIKSLKLFNNFLHSGNITNFNVKDIEIFIDGAMEAHNKSDVVKFVETLKENNKDKNYKIEIKY